MNFVAEVDRIADLFLAKKSIAIELIKYYGNREFEDFFKNFARENISKVDLNFATRQIRAKIFLFLVFVAMQDYEGGGTWDQIIDVFDSVGSDRNKIKKSIIAIITEFDPGFYGRTSFRYVGTLLAISVVPYFWLPGFFDFCYAIYEKNLYLQLDVDGQSDRAILTCKTIELSLFANDIINRSLYQSGGLKTKFYTCRTFKGLEADTIILVDVDEKCFVDDNFLFYVGASRAKKNLYVLINIEEENITRILEKKFPNSFVYKDKKKQLAFAMGGIVL